MRKIFGLILVVLIVAFGVYFFSYKDGSVDAVRSDVYNLFLNVSGTRTPEYTKDLKINSLNGIIENDFYYNTLNDEQKKIYTAISYGVKDFKDRFNVQNYNFVSMEQTLDDVGKALSCFLDDHPEVFYLDISKISMTIEARTEGGTTTYYVKIGPGDYSSYLNSTFANKQEIEDAEEYIIDIRRQVMDILRPYDNAMKIKVVNEWMIDNLSYEDRDGNNNKYNLYGAIVETKVVCEGYARMFKYIMDGLDIPSILVSGTATNSDGQTELHAWNYVELNGQWYAIDVTWNDPVVIGDGELTDSQKSKYLLKGKSFLNDHEEDGMISENSMEFTFPTLNNADYIF